MTREGASIYTSMHATTNFSKLVSSNIFRDLITSPQVYYHMYTGDGTCTSKASFDAEEPSLGCISVINIAPTHNLQSFKRCIPRVEWNPALIAANIYAQLSSDSPSKDFEISLAGTGIRYRDDQPMAVVEQVARCSTSSLLKIKASHSKYVPCA